MGECIHKDDTYYKKIVESEKTDVNAPSELLGWNEDDNVLECKREAEDGDYCIFHADTTDEDIEILNDKLASDFYEDTNVPLVIIGGDLDRLVIDEDDVSRPIWLHGSEFTNRFEINDVNMDNLFLRDVEFNGLVEFKNTDFEGVFSAKNSTFNEITRFHNCKFHDYSDFEKAKFIDEVVMDRDEFGDSLEFSFAKFNSDTKISSCLFKSDSSFYRARFNGETKIARARDIESIDSDVGMMTKFEDYVDFGNTRFSNGSRLYFKIESDADFHKSDIDKCDLRGVDLSESNLENANLEGSILYGADLRGSKLMGTELTGARINNETKFLGNPDRNVVDGYDHSISSILKSRRCHYDPSYQHGTNELEKDKEQLRSEARTVYRELQDLAKSASHSQLQTRAFVHRKDMEKDRYWSDIWSFESGPTQPIVATVRWIRAKASRMIMLYGESPWRVLLWSIGVVVSFAITFVSFGLIENDGEVARVTLNQLLTEPSSALSTAAGAVYYSSLIFTNLSFGRYSPVGAGTYLTAIETTIGLTMLALFFFVLGRRASK